MRLSPALGLASVFIVVMLGAHVAGQGKDKKKFEVPKDAIAGTVKSVDLKAPSFTISTAAGKNRTFLVNDKTEFWGPKGGDRGTGPKGLKDDCMAVGYTIKVAATIDGKTARDVYLPNRKAKKK